MTTLVIVKGLMSKISTVLRIYSNKICQIKYIILMVLNKKGFFSNNNAFKMNCKWENNFFIQYFESMNEPYVRSIHAIMYVHKCGLTQ